MPPAAATECERTGCTLLRMATDAPASAAARAARWPARPAPMMRTSCAGMVGESIEGRRSLGVRWGVRRGPAQGLSDAPPLVPLAHPLALHGARAYLDHGRPRRRPVPHPRDHGGGR